MRPISLVYLGVDHSKKIGKFDSCIIFHQKVFLCFKAESLPSCELERKLELSL